MLEWIRCSTTRHTTMPTKRPKQLKDRSLRIRLTDDDYWRLFAFARQKNTTMTDVIANYLRKLPTLSEDELQRLINEYEAS